MTSTRKRKQPPKPNLKRLRATLDIRSHPPRVVIDPEIMCSTPCLAGSRLPAQTLLDMVDSGDPWERLVEGWPWLTPAHVDAARRWIADGSAAPANYHRRLLRSPLGSFVCRGCRRQVFVRGRCATPVEPQDYTRCEEDDGSVG